jgi:hypothetical protein
MLHSIDHLVILVRDLERASADYARAGFTVTPGGTHAAGTTHNALISFGDGTYFELIAFFEPDREQDHRWWSRVAEGEGLIDYALLSDDLNADASELRGRGLPMEGPSDGGRTRPDGQQIAWRSTMLGRGIGEPVLPFIIEDSTERGLRVPGGEAGRHPLGATRVAGLTLVTDNLEEAAAAMTSLLGSPGEDVVVEDGAMLRYALGSQWLAVLQPGDDASDAGQYLRARGEGPYEITLAGEGDAPPETGDLLPLDLTHGARIRVVR